MSTSSVANQSAATLGTALAMRYFVCVTLCGQSPLVASLAVGLFRGNAPLPELGGLASLNFLSSSTGRLVVVYFSEKQQFAL